MFNLKFNQMGVNVTVPQWKTMKHWAIKGRPATAKKVGNTWRGMPGSENPKPGTNYRLAITWGPKIRINQVEEYMNQAQLRVVFDGWKIGDRLRYRSSIQFYTDETFSTPASPIYRTAINFPPTTIFQPYFSDVVSYAYFRVKSERTRAWKMKYNIGIYGSVHQGTWKKVTAR